MATTFVCQQCKQPLLLDASVADITPSAHDMLDAALPPQSSRSQAKQSSKSSVKAPAAVKEAWENAQPKRESHTQTPASSAGSSRHPATSKRGASASAHGSSGSESFVLLQDSVVQKIPTHHGTMPSSSKGGSLRPSASSRASTHGTTSTTPKRGSIKQLSGSPANHSTPSKSRGVEPSEATPPSTRPPSVTNNLHSTLRLFTLLSSRTELDHPICSDCTNVLLESLERQLEETKRERDGYIAFEREVRKEREAAGSNADEKKMEHRIEKLKAEESTAIVELRAAEAEKIALDAELAALEEEERALEEEELEFWVDQSRTSLAATKSQDTLESLQAALKHSQRELQALSRTNVYNDAFCIGHDGVFGTVNGLRLGRVNGVVVEWAEINAAWGQTLLLLYTIARKLEFTFETFRLVPMGSFSRIEKMQGDKGTYELYGSGDIHLTRILHNRRFDFAMVAFLDCLRQLMEHVKALDPSIEFPHTIVKDKIGEASIKLQFNQEETWTRALRHVLLALKLLLKWATSG